MTVAAMATSCSDKKADENATNDEANKDSQTETQAPAATENGTTTVESIEVVEGTEETPNAGETIVNDAKAAVNDAANAAVNAAVDAAQEKAAAAMQAAQEKAAQAIQNATK